MQGPFLHWGAAPVAPRFLGPCRQVLPAWPNTSSPGQKSEYPICRRVQEFRTTLQELIHLQLDNHPLNVKFNCLTGNELHARTVSAWGHRPHCQLSQTLLLPLPSWLQVLQDELNRD